MTTPHQITDPAELVGKTIVRVVGFLQGEGWPIFRFKDGSFLSLEIASDWSEHNQIFINEDALSLDEQVAIGFMTVEQAMQIECAEKAKQDAERLARTEVEDRAEFARLKAKYEPPESP